MVAAGRPGVVGAQTDLTLEFGAAEVGAPARLDAEDLRFFVGGLRWSYNGELGSGAFASALAGRTFASSDPADFLTITAGGTLVEPWTPSSEGLLDFRALAFGVDAPFPYRALAIEGGLAARFRRGPLTLKVAGIAGAGSSRIEVRQVAGAPTRTFRESLRRAGTTLEVALDRGGFRLEAVGGAHGTPSGPFHLVGARAVLGGSWGALELRGDFWRTPLGDETTGGLSLILPLSSWTVRGFFGRVEPDPLTLSEAGSTGGTLLVGWRLVGPDVSRSGGRALHEIVSRERGRARVRFWIDAPPDARSVALLGDFTWWDPVPMELRGDVWELELEVPEGTHHYGYLVDDEWHVPEGTPDVLPDEWGRTNAILVIEGVD
jgi:hypothetical protein